jgi:hypothetical protein
MVINGHMRNIKGEEAKRKKSGEREGGKGGRIRSYGALRSVRRSY